MLSKKQLFTKGMMDISPHMLSVIPFGIICGAIGVELGFSPYLVYAMSIHYFWRSFTNCISTGTFRRCFSV